MVTISTGACGNWGSGEVQAFKEQTLDLETVDRIQFTCNDRELGWVNGGRGLKANDPKPAQTKSAQARGQQSNQLVRIQY